MSKAYTDLALRCSRFDKMTRLVLFVLAYLSTDKGNVQTNLTDIMGAVNCHRQPTISAILATLEEAGVLSLNPGRYNLNIVLSWHWLTTHAFTPEQLSGFNYKTRTKNWLDDEETVTEEPKFTLPPAPTPAPPKPEPKDVIGEICRVRAEYKEKQDFLAIFPDARSK